MKKFKVTSPRKKDCDLEFIRAAEKIQKFLQEEENKKFGRKAQKVSFAYATRYLYENFLKGKKFGGNNYVSEIFK